MPAIPSASRSKTAPKSTVPKPHPQKHVPKSRVVKRRGRARNGIESDEEIHREARSDSDSDSDLSSMTSDDDTEPASEDITTNGDARILTPSTRTPEDGLPLGNTVKLKPDNTAFFAASTSWSEMVADENANGPADLPVIDFSEFDSRTIPPAKSKTRKPKKGPKKVQPPAASASSLPSPPLSTQEVPDDEPQQAVKEPQPPSRRSSFPPRPFGQSARQAYQERLDSDPSFVPTVGEFWGHDDRLMDKNLRSLSGWWRGRWQSRGRGFPMRGRGGHHPRSSRTRQDSNAEEPPVPSNVPAIERAWTHDGFEEMKKHEEQRRVQQAPSRGSFRGRGTFSPNRGRARLPFSPSRPRSSVALPPNGRVWFTMKPPLMWTKQHDSFLYLDAPSRTRHGEEPTIKVKIPGSRGQVVRPPVQPRSHSIATNIKLTTATSSVHGSEYTDKSYIVRIPKATNKEMRESIVTVEEPPIEDVFTVRPRLVPVEPIPLPAPSNVRVRSSSTATNQAAFYPTPPDMQPNHLPGTSAQQQLEKLVIEPQKPDPIRQAQTEEAVLQNPSPSEESTAPPPLNTTFTSPYGTPYSYPSALSPGIALNQLGVPYELATGRPVYLQSYNPGGLVHPSGMPYVPGHMRHPSAVDYMPPSAHGPPTFIDPTTGTPIFSFPRSNPIQIRAPSEPAKAVSFKSTTNHQRTSGLSTNAPEFEPGSGHVRFPSLSASAELAASSSYPPAQSSETGPESQQNEMMYQPYQHPYYYPEAYYNPYVDMQYGEMYSQDPQQVPMGTVYYT